MEDVPCILELINVRSCDSGSDSSHKQSLHFCIEGINDVTNKFRDVFVTGMSTENNASAHALTNAQKQCRLLSFV